METVALFFKKKKEYRKNIKRIGVFGLGIFRKERFFMMEGIFIHVD
jgi:hypothetical protein